MLATYPYIHVQCKCVEPIIRFFFKLYSVNSAQLVSWLMFMLLQDLDSGWRKKKKVFYLLQNQVRVQKTKMKNKKTATKSLIIITIWIDYVKAVLLLLLFFYCWMRLFTITKNNLGLGRGGVYDSYYSYCERENVTFLLWKILQTYYQIFCFKCSEEIKRSSHCCANPHQSMNAFYCVQLLWWSAALQTEMTTFLL